MTQQPYYPQAPQQGYPQQPPAPQFPQAPVQQGYPAPPPQQFPAQAYPAAPYGAPQQPPAQPLVTGNLDDFYNQPSAGGGPSLSWTDKQSNQPKPIGTQYVGIVARDVTNADVQQQTDFRTQAPLFYKDGRPKFAMKVPLKLQPSPEFPDGEASWFVKGQARDELVRAMSEAGCTGSPKAGAVISVTLVARRNTGAGMNPANVVQVVYQPPQGGSAPQAPAPQQQTAPAEQPSPYLQQAAQEVAQIPNPVQQAYAQQYQQVAPEQPAPQQYAQPQAPQQQAFAPPAQQQAPAPQPPSDLSAEQQALLARLTGAPQPAGQ